jgi:hypothetical protein
MWMHSKVERIRGSQNQSFVLLAQNKTHALNNEIVVNALAGVIGVGITYIKDDEDILPILKASN